MEKLTFDGVGINDAADIYKPRLATFSRDLLKSDRADKIGRLFVAAPRLLAALEKAEAFIAGFEDDEMQDGINDTLAEIRAAIKTAKGA